MTALPDHVRTDAPGSSGPGEITHDAMSATFAMPGGDARAGPVAWASELADQAHRFGFFQAVRLLEAVRPDLPRVGTGLRLRDDPVRFAQAPSLAFASATLARFLPGSRGAAPTLRVRFFGLFGPNGPLPLHLSEFVRERARRMPADRAPLRFLDMFHHRMLSLLYRAWAEARPTVNLHRAAEDPFSRWVGAIAGYGQASLRGRDSVPDGARLAAAGLLGRSVRGADGLERLLADFFRVRVVVHQWQPHWMRLPAELRSRIGARSAGAALGRGALLGSRAWDCQSCFRIEIGPLTIARYQRFLPGGTSLRRLRDWVFGYIGHELSCELQLVLRGQDVPALRLGGAAALGLSSWLGSRHQDGDAADLVFALMPSSPARC